MAFVRVARLPDLPAGGLLLVQAGHTPILLSNVDGELFATSDTCCHLGGPLQEGTLTGSTITCPWHFWTYDVRDGRCLINAGARLLTYPVRSVDGMIEVDPSPA